MKRFNEERLQEYLDGALDEAERQAVEAHLARSPSAQAQLAEMEALFADLAGMPERPLTTDLSARVVTELGVETAVSAPPPRWFWALLLVQVLAALLLLGNIWSSLLGWLGNGRQAAFAWFDSLEQATTTFISQLWGGLDSLLQTPVLPNLAVDLPIGQWALLFSLALVVWLAGNRLLFVNE